MYTYYVPMKNITLSAEEDLITKARAYAHQCNTTLNQLIRDLLSQKVLPAHQSTIKKAFDLLDCYPSTVKNYRYRREDAYDV